MEQPIVNEALERIRKRTESNLDALRKGRSTGEIPEELGNGVVWLMLGMWRRDESSSVHWIADSDSGVLRLVAEDCPPHEVPLLQVGTAEGVLECVVSLAGKAWATVAILSEFIGAAVELHGKHSTH